MLTQSVYQHPRDLVLGLLIQEVPLQFKILKQASLEYADWRFQFSIIGESHWIRIEREGQLVLQEILACVPLPAEQCLHYHLGQEQHQFDWQNYTVTLNFDTQPTPFPAENTLLIDFPEMYGQVPVTAIHWELSPASLQWWTLHTYPQPDHIICVRTISKWGF